MILRLCTLFALLLFLQTGFGWAQDATQPSRINPAQQAVGYPVTGRVLCADTQRPARFAQITLVPASSQTSEYDRGRRAVARTDLDGRFVMDNVPPGDYFATADLTGYVNEAPAVQTALSAGGDALDAVAAVPRFQVTAGGGSVQLSLQRGAVLTGTVQWDDGSPAAGIQISAQAATATGVSGVTLDQATTSGFNRPGPSRFTGGSTDDRGRFRLSGLAAGTYVLRANLQAPSPSAPSNGNRFPRLLTLRVYAPNKLRQTEATVFTLATGEERGDVAVTLNLGGMHTVAGQVSSSAAAVRSGSVQLTDQTDATLNRRGDINADGTFVVPYVPPGTYTLRVAASAQTAGPGRGAADEPSAHFQPLQESVTVADSDLSGLLLTVTPATGTP